MKKYSPRKRLTGVVLTFLTGGGAFFLMYYTGTIGRHTSETSQLSPHEILDRAVKPSGVDQVNTIRKDKNEIILENKN